MKIIKVIILLIISNLSYSQITGIVTDKNQQPLAYVNIYLENTSVGTTSNEKGAYWLQINQKNITIVFQSLGYKTQKIALNINDFPHTLNVTLSEESFLLDEVVISNKDNPANQIIRKTIENKRKNSEKTSRFEADFYSKGILKMKNVPKKILGKEVGDMGGNIDSTGAGIVYQSETISKVKFEKPHNVKEHIIASKVAGNSNGISFNTAEDVNFDVYDNYLNFDVKIVSPIADNAFSYYRFELENSFYDDKNHLINKIKITPKRDKEAVFEGYIYIVEDSWAVYGVDLLLKGYRMQNPAIQELNLIQNYNFNPQQHIWNKKLQHILVNFKILMINIEGSFSYVYNNYVFVEKFDKNQFKSEIRSFDKNANKKDSLYWAKVRQIPLTEEESVNYVKKDSIEKVRTSIQYLDSIDRKHNKFRLAQLLTGYTHKNQAKKKSFAYKGLTDIGTMTFNTVQGFNIETGFSYNKRNEETLAFTKIDTDFEYSFAEKRLRVFGKFKRVFNRMAYPTLEIYAGSKAQQFNYKNPISEIVNDVSTLFFKDNYMKLHNNDFLQVMYGQYISKDIILSGNLLLSQRSPLWNNTNYSFTNRNKEYTSNHPLLPDDYAQNFEKHYVTKFSLLASFNINNRYVSYPNRRRFVPDERYPSFKTIFINTFHASKKDYQHQFLAGEMIYNPSFNNKGKMSINLSAGTFFNAEKISFIDYQHFNGNQTHVKLTDENDSFNLLPYYAYSTNKGFVETHIQHHFRGFISSKIPIFNKLQWNFVIGFHQLNRAETKPYQEYSIGLENIGWGMFRFLRVDYVRCYEGQFKNDGVMFGISLPISTE